MKIYQVSLIDVDENKSLGYVYFSNMRAAAKAHRENGARGVIHAIEVSLTRYGILKAFNLYDSHPDNG